MNRITKLLLLASFLLAFQFANAQTAAVVVRPPAAPGPTVVAVAATPAAPVARRVARKQARKAARRQTRKVARRTARRVARRS